MNLGKVVLITGMGILLNIYILCFYDLTDAEYSDRLHLSHRRFRPLYMSMVAEENTKLGVHLLLFEKYSPEKAANSLKGVSWQKLNKM